MYRTKIYISSFFLLLFFLGNIQAGVILDINAFKVSKSAPGEFLFDLIENDVVIFTFDAISGKVDKDKVKLELIDLNSVEEEVIASMKIPSGKFRVPYDGKYKLRFVYNGKSFLGKSWKYGLFRLTVESVKTNTQEPGEFRTLLQARAVALDDDKENSLKLVIPVNKGDEISIVSSDPKASIVKVNLLQLGKTTFISGASSIIAEQDYNLTIKIFLADEGSSMFNIKELLRNGDNVIEDLNISLTKKARDQQVNSVNSQTGEVLTNSEGVDDANDPFSLIEKMEEQQRQRALEFQETSANASNFQEAQLAYQKEQAEYEKEYKKAMMELLKPKERKIISPALVNSKSEKLGPVENLFRKNKNQASPNKICFPLGLGGSNHNQWFYWVGVGKGAKEAYQTEQDRFLQSRAGRKNLEQAKAEYIYYMNDPLKRVSNPRFPDAKRYPEFFSEDVEFAIVDDPNMERFLDGKKYIDVNFNSKPNIITTTTGFAFTPPSSETIFYACFCNNNKRTPIEFIFKYFMINTENESY